MRIIYNNIDFGDWDEHSLDMLASNQGVSVEALIESSQIALQKIAIAETAKLEVGKRLGPQRKINEVTANVAYMALAVSLITLKVAYSGSDTPAEDIGAALNEVFPNEQGEAAGRFIGVADAMISGSMKSPVHAYGVKKSADKALDCANEAYKIILDAAQGFAAKGDVEPV